MAKPVRIGDIPKRKSKYESIPANLKCSRCGRNAREYYDETGGELALVAFLTPTKAEVPDTYRVCHQCMVIIVDFVKGRM